MNKKIDPIRKKYFDPLEKAEHCSSVLFYVALLLSLAVLVVDSDRHSVLHDWAQGVFLLVVLAAFALGQFTRLYLAPRAEDKRNEDLLSDAFGVSLTHERTTGYYNNDETNPQRRLGVSLLENSFFSKEIVRSMLKRERFLVVAYLIVWLVLLSARNADLSWIVVFAQAIFGEEIASRWLRLEWMRGRFERVYSDVLRLLTSGGREDTFAHVVQSLLAYEGTKARGSVVLSSKLFERLNPQLSREWGAIRASVGL